MSFTQDLFTSRTNLVDGTTKLGHLDRLWYEPQTNTIRVGNGQPGGLIVGGVGGQVNADWNATIGISTILNKPSLATVATTGDYADLSNQPTQLSQFINNVGFITTGYNPFDQDLNTTDSVQFAEVNNTGIVYTPYLISPDHLDLVIQSHIDKTGDVKLYGNQVEIYTTTNPIPSFQVDQYGQIKILTPVFDPAAGSLSIIGSDDGTYHALESTGCMLHITGQRSTVSRIYNDSVNSYAEYVGRRYNGNTSAPTHIVAGDILSMFTASGYDGTAFPLVKPASIQFVASQDYSPAQSGTKIDFYVTPNDNTNPLRKLSVSEHGITFSDNTSQDTAAIPLNYIGAVNGVASLGDDGKVPVSQLSITESVVYKGTWDASSNIPYLHNGSGTTGWEYKVITGGTVDFGDGNIVFGTGDWVIYNGTKWEKIPGTVGVTTFNSRTGDVSLLSSDVTGALGFTPYSNTNPNNYITISDIPSNVLSFNGRSGIVSLQSSDVIAALSAGSIQNAKLANSSFTIGSTTISLGDTVTSLSGLTAITASNVTATGALAVSNKGSFNYGTLTYTDTGIFASYSANTNGYNQMVLQNTSSGSSSSSNYIVSNNLGTASTYYGEFGMNSSGFTGSGPLNAPNIVYLASASSDLIIGTNENHSLRMVTNNTSALTIDGSGVITVANPIVGNITGNAGTVTNGVYTSGNQTITGTKTFSSTIVGNISGNADTVTNGIYTTDTGTVSNTMLAHNTVTINTGTGLSGGGAVALGGSLTLTCNVSAYTLPIATATTLGGIKIGSGLNIDGSGVVSTNVSTDNAAFYDTSTQNIVNVTNVYPVIINSTFNSSPYISVTSNSYITVAHAGKYHFEYSIQMINPNNSQYDVEFWFRKNDIDVPYSGSVFTLPPRINAGVSSKLIAASPFDIELNANDKIQVMWWVNASNITIETVPAGTSPSRPASPGVIINVRKFA